ncbi:MAG TPA: Mrp/NBP35 family ATP-binding protein [Candidatus Faecivicinus avistercoris]|nr:Mrp/NBP35 family ATP-binding protein [Candidatus Faecivicinus avistercoris]
MSENCNHDCGSCSANCASREGAAPDFSAKPNPHSHVKKVIGVVSGKGGVGKSLVTSMMAVLLRRRGQNVAILDADITGPSIPRMFGVHGQLSATDEGIIPAASTTGVKMVSLNLLLERETDPVVWRGPVIAGTVKQFWSDVMWGDVDYMFVDMPPGTGDVPLTVFQSLPVNGILIVTSPQELVGMIVEKAVRMANMMNVPVLGLVENMSYFQCDECGKKHYIFGQSRLDDVARHNDIAMSARLPLNPALSAACDAGKIEMFDGDWLDAMAEALMKL